MNPPIAHRFKPGQSGNPSGRPKKKPLTEALERLLIDGIVPDDADGVASLFVGKKWADVVARGLITSAIAGDAPAFREAADRVEGKVTEKVQHSGEVSYIIEPTRPLTPQAWLAAHAESQQAIAEADMGLTAQESAGEPN